MRPGIWRPLLLSAGVIVAFTLVLVAANWRTFRLMASNVAAMGEGRAAAAQMRSPDDLLAYIAAHPDDVSLVAFDVDRPEGGIYFGADAVRPVTGVPRLLALAEYARQVEADRLDPREPVRLAELRAAALPGAADVHSSYESAGADSTTALGSVVEAMVRGNDPAAADVLLHRLGHESLARLPARLGRPTLDPPLPSAGLYLSWSNHTLQRPPEQRLLDFQTQPRPGHVREVYALADAYRTDTDFRGREIERRIQAGAGLSLRQQQAMARATFPRGTAAGYASILARALGDSLLSPAVSRRVLEALARPVPDSAGVSLTVVGSEGGSFPGLISFVGYARRADRASPRVVALLMENVPTAVFYHLAQTGLDRGLQLQLLGDDAYFEEARRRMTNDE